MTEAGEMMDTLYIRVSREQPDKRELQRAAKLICGGGLVAFPTETVYGLGANGLDAKAVAGIYRAKGRPSDNPLILHIADKKELEPLVTEITANAVVLMETYWPGPLTVVLRKTDIVPSIVSGGLDTVAVRLPDSVVARGLIEMTGVPIAAPSANTSGRPSPTSAAAVLADLAGRIDAVIDAGNCDIGLESTVVDCTTPVPTLLRPGGITLEMLMETLGEVEVDPTLAGSVDVIPRSPGMKYTHYAPKAPMILIEGDYFAVSHLLCREVELALAQGRKVGAVVSAETAQILPDETVTAVYGSRKDAAAIAAGLYGALRSFDQRSVEVIYAEGISEQGLGLAVMNRLRKASGYHILRA
jgi:L-threonylcarbamoyladenylate synthase